jgi:hypothetical protein
MRKHVQDMLAIRVELDDEATRSSQAKSLFLDNDLKAADAATEL